MRRDHWCALGVPVHADASDVRVAEALKLYEASTDAHQLRPKNDFGSIGTLGSLPDA